MSRRPWTRADLTRRLIRRGAPAELAATLVADLVTRGYVDDTAFARRWVEARAARGYGAARLRAELGARGVARDVIDLALSVLQGETTLERARDMARRRLRGLRGRPDRAAARLRDHLLRRGYAPAVAARVVRELVDELPEPGAGT